MKSLQENYSEVATAAWEAGSTPILTLEPPPSKGAADSSLLPSSGIV